MMLDADAWLDECFDINDRARNRVECERCEETIFIENAKMLDDSWFCQDCYEEEVDAD